MENLFKHSSGYAIFPNVGKGGVGVGGACGKEQSMKKECLLVPPRWCR